MDDMFSEYYVPNLQTCYKKTKKVRDELINIEIIDLEGQNEYSQIINPKIFQYGIDGYILCYSIENLQSFNLIQTLNTKLMNLVGREVPKILVANKNDLLNKR